MQCVNNNSVSEDRGGAAAAAAAAVAAAAAAVASARGCNANNNGSSIDTSQQLSNTISITTGKLRIINHHENPSWTLHNHIDSFITAIKPNHD